MTVIHRRDELRAGAILQKRAFANPKINFIWDSVVTEIIGDEGVEAIKIHNVKTGEDQEFPTEGVFVFIGHSPNSDLFEEQLSIDGNGYILTNKLLETSIPVSYTHL